MSYYQIIQMTNGKKIKFSHAAINHLAGNAASTQEEDSIIRNWYERNAAAKLLATYARGKEDVIGICEVEYTERNVFAGERVYTVKSHKEKVMVDNRLIDVFDAMTCKVHGGTAYLWVDGSIWFIMGKDGTGTTPAAEAVEIELTPTEGNVTAEPFAIPARTPSPSAEYAQAGEELCPDMVYAKRHALAFATPSAEPVTTQEDTAEGVELPTQKVDVATAENGVIKSIEIVLGLNESDPIFGAAIIKASQDNTVSPDLAGAYIVTSLAKELPGVAVTIRIDPFGNTTITTTTGRADFDAAARKAIKRVVKDELWVVGGSGYFSRSPNRKPITPIDGLLPINHWQASAEKAAEPDESAIAPMLQAFVDSVERKADERAAKAAAELARLRAEPPTPAQSGTAELIDFTALSFGEKDEVVATIAEKITDGDSPSAKAIVELYIVSAELPDAVWCALWWWDAPINKDAFFAWDHCFRGWQAAGCAAPVDPEIATDHRPSFADLGKAMKAWVVADIAQKIIDGRPGSAKLAIQAFCMTDAIQHLFGIT